MSIVIQPTTFFQVSISQEISVFYLLGVYKKQPVVLAIASEYFL